MNFRILFCMLITTASYAQNNVFDSLYQHTTKMSLSSAPQDVLIQVTDLEQLATTQTQQIEAGMLKASLLRRYGVRDKAILALKTADSIAVKARYVNFQARIHGALSTLYRENGIESLGKQALVKAIYCSKSMTDPLELAILKGNLQQEQAYYFMNSTRFADAIEALKEGRLEFEKVENQQQRSFYLACMDQLIGENYIRIGKMEFAIDILNQALSELTLSDNPQSPLKGFIYNSLGELYLKNQDYETALSFLNHAQVVADQTGFLTLQKQVLSSLKEHAIKIDDTKKYVLYNEKYVQLVEHEFNVQTKIADYLVESFSEKEDELAVAYKNYVLYSLALGSGIVLFLSLYFYRKQQYNKRKIVFNDLPLSQLSPVEKNNLNAQKSSIDVDYNYISREMEALILKGMKTFEMQRGFLKHEISLSKLASQIGVNHRYLSYVIKHHKHQDFSTYINTLRIDYIIALLETNPDMLKYKISYLADLCGFASHSRFTITFKRVKGISPSTFIEQIKERN